MNRDSSVRLKYTGYGTMAREPYTSSSLLHKIANAILVASKSAKTEDGASRRYDEGRQL